MNFSRTAKALFLCVMATVTNASAQQVPGPTDARHPRARVVSSFRDQGGTLTIYLDVGSGRGIRPGMRGHVLEGETERLLASGEFVVVRVVSATQSIGRLSGVRSLGRNTRAVVHLVRWP